MITQSTPCSLCKLILLSQHIKLNFSTIGVEQKKGWCNSRTYKVKLKLFFLYYNLYCFIPFECTAKKALFLFLLKFHFIMLARASSMCNYSVNEFCAVRNENVDFRLSQKNNAESLHALNRPIVCAHFPSGYALKWIKLWKWEKIKLFLLHP